MSILRFSLKPYALLSVLISMPAVAATKGPYVGVQLGWANTHQGEFIGDHLNDLVNKPFSGKPLNTEELTMFYNNTGLAGRIFVGFQFNPYFAIESGYYRFTRLDLNTKLNISVKFLEKYGKPLTVASHAVVNTYAIDMIAKGIYPITKKLSLYGKLGLAYLNADGAVSVTAQSQITENIDAGVTLSSNPSVNVVYPALGVGINYDLTEQVSTDLSWMRIQQYNNKSFPSVDFVSVGLLYHFN